MPANQATSNPLSQTLDLSEGGTREVIIDGRKVRLQVAEPGVAVLSSQGNAVVVRLQGDGRFIVTGALAHHRPSEPLDADGAIRVALTRLDR